MDPMPTMLKAGERIEYPGVRHLSLLLLENQGRDGSRSLRSTSSPVDWLAALCSELSGCHRTLVDY